MKKAIITVGLGFGDCGKGATVDYLARKHNAELVVRYSGGSQAGHNVELPDGFRHTFSQYGAGTLAGVPTYLGRHVIINPPAMEREHNHLFKYIQRDTALGQFCVHPKCLVSTPIQQALNQAKEIARGENRHGSCGHGIGETRSYWLKYGSDAVVAIDLIDAYKSVLKDKLELMRQRLLPEFPTIEQKAKSDLSVRCMANQLRSANYLFGISSPHLDDHDTVIFEGAQGVLLDETHGFQPHTTWSTVTPQHALEMCEEEGCEDVTVLGVTRAYATRHGAGPFPTEDNRAFLTDPGNPPNQWQEFLRVGYLDLVMLRYATECCGRLDGMIVNHLDQIVPDGKRKVCTSYKPPHGGPDNHLAEWWNLSNAVPVYEDMSRDEWMGKLNEIAPVVLTGHGPTWKDRKENR
jgi:adenylosuccinate synthase